MSIYPAFYLNNMTPDYDIPPDWPENFQLDAAARLFSAWRIMNGIRWLKAVPVVSVF